jgi:hypothetical protein
METKTVVKLAEDEINKIKETAKFIFKQMKKVKKIAGEDDSKLHPVEIEISTNAWKKSLASFITELNKGKKL